MVQSVYRSTNHRLNPRLSTWEITPPHEHSRRGREQQAASNKQEQNNSKLVETLERIASGAETNTNTLLMKSSMMIVLLKLLTENSNSCWAQVQKSSVSRQKTEAADFLTQPLTHREVRWGNRRLHVTHPVPFSTCLVTLHCYSFHAFGALRVKVTDES